MTLGKPPEQQSSPPAMQDPESRAILGSMMLEADPRWYEGARQSLSRN